MSRYLLDTNIVSQGISPRPPAALAHWFAAQSSATFFIAALTLAEIERGILTAPAGRRGRALRDWFDGPQGPRGLFAGRILPFDDRAAHVWANLMAAGDRQGRPRSALDTLIAATAITNDCTVVTLNERHFPGVPVLNPLRPG